MKRFYSFSAMALVLAMLMSSAGCNTSESVSSSVTAEVTESEQIDNRMTAATGETKDTVDPDVSEPNQSIASDALITDPTTESTTGTTTESTSAPTPTPKPIGKATVSDAYKRKFKVPDYGKMTTRYPKITIDGADTSAINKKIEKKFRPIAKKNQSVVSYKYYIGKTYVSIFMIVNLDAGLEGDDHYVYNVSRVTGKELSRKEMLKELGLKNGTFNSKVKKSLKKWWKQFLDFDQGDYTKNMYKKALTNKSINSAVPFVDSKGKKSFLIRQMEVPAQIDHYDVYAAI